MQNNRFSNIVPYIGKTFEENNFIFLGSLKPCLYYLLLFLVPLNFVSLSILCLLSLYQQIHTFWCTVKIIIDLYHAGMRNVLFFSVLILIRKKNLQHLLGRRAKQTKRVDLLSNFFSIKNHIQAASLHTHTHLMLILYTTYSHKLFVI